MKKCLLLTLIIFSLVLSLATIIYVTSDTNYLLKIKAKTNSCLKNDLYIYDDNSYEIGKEEKRPGNKEDINELIRALKNTYPKKDKYEVYYKGKKYFVPDDILNNFLNKLNMGC